MEISREDSDLALSDSEYFFGSSSVDFDSSGLDFKDSKYEGLSNMSNLFCPNAQHESGVHSFQCKPDADCIKMFVGQIPQHFNEYDLLQMFEKFGKVYDVRVLKDKVTGKSKGCCFVTFFTRRAALSAQDALHNIKVLPGMHHPIQMKPADCENRNDRKLFVGMLSRNLSESDVRNLFSPYGTIEECTVLRDPSGQSKGCSFVTYLSRHSAQNAVKSMHHCTIFEGCSSPLVVKFADTQKDKEIRRMQLFKNDINDLTQFPNILQQLPADSLLSLVASNNLLQQLQHGSYINLNPQLPLLNVPLGQTLNWTGSPTRPVGLLQRVANSYLLNQPSAQNINEQLVLNNLLSQRSVTVNQGLHPQGFIGNVCNQPPLPLERITTRRFSDNWGVSPKQIEGPDGANLFIYHLPQEFTDQRLAELFHPFGNVISAKVFIDKHTKLSKCFGFVSYDNVGSAKTAIQNLNGHPILGKKLKVEVKKNKSTTR